MSIHDRLNSGQSRPLWPLLRRLSLLKNYLGAQLFNAVQGFRFDTLAHSPFDFSLRLYVDLLEGAASLQIEYVLVHRYPYRAWFWGRRTLAQREFSIDSGLLTQATCRVTPTKFCLTLAFLK